MRQSHIRIKLTCLFNDYDFQLADNEIQSLIVFLPVEGCVCNLTIVLERCQDVRIANIVAVSSVLCDVNVIFTVE